MKKLLLISVLFSMAIADINEKIDEYCTMKSSIYPSERVKKHTYNRCIKEILNKKLSINTVTKMISDENPTKLKKKRIKLQEKYAQKIKKTTQSNMTTKGNPYFACGEKSWLSDMNVYLYRRDTIRVTASMANKKCFLLQEGLPINIITTDATSVQFICEGYGTLSIWANVEAINNFNNMDSILHKSDN